MATMTMKRAIHLAIVVSTLAIASGHVLIAAASSNQSSGTPNASAAVPRATLDRYCVTCHNDKARTGGLSLQDLDLAKVVQGDDGAVWEKVVRQLRLGSMPPPGVPRPESSEYQRVAGWLETQLDRAAASHPEPGRLPAFQRLTRTEYQNAIRDLLLLETLPKDLDISALLPADGGTSGFDTVRDLLFVSSTQLEQYLSAAKKISRFAVGDRSAPMLVDQYRAPSTVPQDVYLEGAPFGTRGGMVIDTNLPLDGEYTINVALTRVPRTTEHVEVSVDGERIRLISLSSEAMENEALRIAVEQGYITKETSEKTGTHKFVNWQRRDAIARFVGKGFDVVAPLKAGPRRIVATFIQRTSAVGEQQVRPALRGRGSEVAVASVTIKGPVNGNGAGDTPSRRRIFTCQPSRAGEERQCATRILSTLARRAYRRPVTDTDLRNLLSVYDTARRDHGFEAGIQWAIERILVSPQFLFRIERDPNGGPNTLYRIADLELASRLSFFLWSSIPDDRLLDLAVAGKLKNATILEQQVRRMLADPRSEALVNNFAAQWLFLRDVESKNPNARLFRDFDGNLQQSLVRETELFVNSVLREDRSVLDLLDANFTFVNERLAKHYGIPNVYGSDFQRVTLSDESPRRGLLGKGAILALSSHATRTSPVNRGKYVLDNLLSTPPPPPPANVPALQDKSSDGRPLSMREAMVKHRANPVCASCHARMDPIGFALENFDAVGRWRTRDDSGEPIDASAVLQDGTKFDGVAGLRRLLRARSEMFITGLTEKLLTYAVGRKANHHDAPAIRKIVRDAAKNDYQFSSLVLGIVNSVPFQMRKMDSRADALALRH